jgi:hypothetical protein
LIVMDDRKSSSGWPLNPSISSPTIATTIS